MHTYIESYDFPLTVSLEQFIRRQIDQASLPCQQHIDRFSVRLKDLNGPKGGEDKNCTVEIHLPGKPPVVVTKRDTDAYACAKSAIERAGRVALRRLAKQRSVRLRGNSVVPLEVDTQHTPAQTHILDEDTEYGFLDDQREANYLSQSA